MLRVLGFWGWAVRVLRFSFGFGGHLEDPTSVVQSLWGFCNGLLSIKHIGFKGLGLGRPALVFWGGGPPSIIVLKVF